MDHIRRGPVGTGSLEARKRRNGTPMMLMMPARGAASSASWGAVSPWTIKSRFFSSLPQDWPRGYFSKRSVLMMLILGALADPKITQNPSVPWGLASGTYVNFRAVLAGGPGGSLKGSATPGPPRIELELIRPCRRGPGGSPCLELWLYRGWCRWRRPPCLCIIGPPTTAPKFTCAPAANLHGTEGFLKNFGGPPEPPESAS